ncbi:E3 ubiquitin-protein ligase RNF115 isoform X3 [Lathamus discolor]|uniref:E3 ubiquitin-protein ligase RNF115 isoform X3 n=1 Tax=Lathamus discolor TaxID=678569 RepID=UPI0032B72F94
MAEASAAAVPQHRFFCHSCKGEVSPKLPEYTCPRCESGFIEEVTEDSSFLDGSGIDDSPATQFAELWDHLDHTMFFPDFRPFLSSSSLEQDNRDTERGHQAHADLWGPSRPPRLPMTRRYRARGSSRPDRSPAIEGYRPGVPGVQRGLRSGRAGPAAALQPLLPQQLHCALVRAARHVSCVQEEPQGGGFQSAPTGGLCQPSAGAMDFLMLPSFPGGSAWSIPPQCTLYSNSNLQVQPRVAGTVEQGGTHCSECWLSLLNPSPSVSIGIASLVRNSFLLE